MTGPIVALPTPEQIAEAPEIVALHVLGQVLELTLRALVAAYPGLDDPDLPF